MSESKRAQLGIASRAELVGYAGVAGSDASLLTQPSRAVAAALGREGLSVSDVDLFETNEAFAAVALASMADLGIGEDLVNVNGGAIAYGHPLGMSGARLVITLVEELRRRAVGWARRPSAAAADRAMPLWSGGRGRDDPHRLRSSQLPAPCRARPRALRPRALRKARRV